MSKYHIIIDLNFDFLSDEYKNLYAASEVTAFQSPLWLHHLHLDLLPNLASQKHTIVIRNKQDQTLLAVFPFVIQNAVLGKKILQFADFGCSDYNSVIGKKTILQSLARDKDVLDKIDKITKQADLLLIRKVRTDSFDIHLFFKRMTKTPNDNAAYHFVPKDDVKDWEQQIFSKSFLKKLRRYERKFTKDHGSYHLKKITEPNDIKTALEAMKRFHKNRFEESLLQQNTYLHFYQNYIFDAVASNEGALFALYFDNKIIASEFVLVKDNGFTSILTAANMDQYGQYSLGHQILYKLCQCLVSEGNSHIDLGIGGYSYKKSFNVQETKLYNYSQAVSLSGSAVAMTYNYAKPLKNILKRYVPHVR